MGSAIGSFLPHAVGVALSPLPIAAVILILFSGRPRKRPDQMKKHAQRRPRVGTTLRVITMIKQPTTPAWAGSN